MAFRKEWIAARRRTVIHSGGVRTKFRTVDFPVPHGPCKAKTNGSEASICSMERASIGTFPEHKVATAWLEELVEGPDRIGLPWITIWGYLRLATSNRAFATNVTAEDAFAFLQELLSVSKVIQVDPGPDHLNLLRQLAVGGQCTGPKLTDAALAALAIEHGATLASNDKDFSRFPKLKWVNPLG